MCEIDVQCHAPQKALEFVDSFAANDITKREDDRIGLRSATQDRACLFNQGFGKV